MVKETRFYELLGIPPDDGNNKIEGDDLKKAYRKAALKAHPDKGGSDEQFKLVTEAYNILNDPAKREVYNSRGEKGVQEMNERGPEMDPQDLFSQLFGGGGGFFGGPGGQRAGPRKSKDLVHRVHVSLEDLYKGKTTKLALSRHVTCTKCNGKGGKEGAVKSCQSCGGRGSKFILRQIGPMLQQIQQTCNDCDGAGETINAKDRCKVCNGKKIVAEKKVLDVHIDKGMKGGQTVTFQGQSDYGPDTLPGDVVIVIEEKAHERFKREGNDLWHETEIDLLTALGGGQFSIKHLDERVLIVKIEPGEVIKPGALKVISGQGMPSLRHHELGDLYVRLNIEFPETIDGDMLHHLEAALPPRRPLQPPPPGFDVEEVEMGDLDARQQRNAQREGDEMDEDEEGPARMQCSNQ